MTRRWDRESDLSNYLKKGGLLLSPDDVIDPYRTALIKLIAAFFDSELAVSAGSACMLNTAPNIKQRVHLARFVAEKAEHAKTLLDILGGLAAESCEYLDRFNSAEGYQWSVRIPRDDGISVGASISLDKRLPFLYYPIENWLDGVIMYVLTEKCARILIQEAAKVFYKPLAVACQIVMTSEREHAQLSHEELLRLAKGAYKNGTFLAIESSFDFWVDRISASFDIANLPYFECLRQLGLEHRSNQEMLEDFNINVAELRHSLHLVTHL